MSLINEQLKKFNSLLTTEVNYANYASAAFNLRLFKTLKRIAADVHQALGDNLIALILGGDYGRREGGVIRIDGIERGYNDLDFTLIVERKRGVDFQSLNRISEKFTQELKIHINFSHPLTLAHVRNLPHRLKWHDLLKGHVVTFGSKDVLTTNAPASLHQPLPTIEATRMLLNRGAGLLWAMRVACQVEKEPDADFVRRNYYKCALALGDALLITHKRYRTQYTERDELVDRLAYENVDVAAMNLNELYADALRFKFAPDEISNLPLSEEQLQVLAEVWGIVFLYVEQERTGRAFNSLDEYIAWDGLREFDQHTVRRLARNAICNLQMKKLSLRYPREELFRTLPALLGICQKPVSHWEEKSKRFLELWRRFN